MTADQFTEMPAEERRRLGLRAWDIEQVGPRVRAAAREKSEGRNEGAPALIVRGLMVRYGRSGPFVVNDCDFDAAAGASGGARRAKRSGQNDVRALSRRSSCGGGGRDSHRGRGARAAQACGSRVSWHAGKWLPAVQRHGRRRAAPRARRVSCAQGASGRRRRGLMTSRNRKPPSSRPRSRTSASRICATGIRSLFRAASASASLSPPGRCRDRACSCSTSRRADSILRIWSASPQK